MVILCKKLVSFSLGSHGGHSCHTNRHIITHLCFLPHSFNISIVFLQENLLFKYRMSASFFKYILTIVFCSITFTLVSNVQIHNFKIINSGHFLPWLHPIFDLYRHLVLNFKNFLLTMYKEVCKKVSRTRKMLYFFLGFIM